MKSLGIVDVSILLVYLALMVIIGVYFGSGKRGSGAFTKADGKLPSWVVGLSIFGTYLSSNTFIGVTGKAFGSNWNSFVFSLSLPIAAFIAVRYFVPFYRLGGHISAYEHMEKRFGLWARTYMVVCYLLTQLARMASIMYGVSLVLAFFIPIDIIYIIILAGLLITIYTFLGGIEAVIWTDVIQSILLTTGALFILVQLFVEIDEGILGFINRGFEYQKFSLGSYEFGISNSTFWVVCAYGIIINLNNFGVDQNFIQRYHAARTSKEAGNSVWLAAGLYIPISLLFFIIGSALFVYFNQHPNELETIKISFFNNLLTTNSVNITDVKQISQEMIADSVMPYYMINHLPVGLSGLLIAALFAAAMSSVDSGLNSSATVIWSDIYKRYMNNNPTEKQSMFVLRFSTFLWGILGTLLTIGLIGTESILDTWWKLSGIFAGGMLGLFLLGIISQKTDGHVAMISVLIGILVIGWLTFSYYLPENLAWLKSPFHANMIVVIGTLSIFLTGVLITKLKS